MTAHQADTCGWCGTGLVGHVDQSSFGWVCGDSGACNSRYLTGKAAAARVERDADAAALDCERFGHEFDGEGCCTCCAAVVPLVTL